LRGIFLPITTPFRANGAIDLDGLSDNIRKWNQTAIAGYVLLGSTGERVHLDEAEYEQVVSTARSAVPSDRVFIVGAGQQSTAGTITEISKAAAVGADAVLVLTPYFYRPAINQDLLANHYRAIVDAAPVPVLLYSMPIFTGVRIESETIASLSSHPNIIGAKDSSADVEGFRRTLELTRKETASDQFAVLTGNGTVLRDALTAGGDGAILAVACAVPELCIEIFRAVKDGDEERAEFLQEKLTPLAHAVTTQYGIGGLKLALDLAGYQGGYVRAPLRMPDERARAEISELLLAARHAEVSSMDQPLSARR
jgi:4-hydroxy-2-oxoglutarate aldolase